MNAILTSTQDIRQPVNRALPPTLTVYRTSVHGGLKVPLEFLEVPARSPLERGDALAIRFAVLVGKFE